MEELVEVWNNYYAADSDTAIKDRYFFSLEVAGIVRHVRDEQLRGSRTAISILELGSATGYLAKSIVEGLAEFSALPVSYVGVDFSEVAVEKANSRGIKGCTFVASDFFEYLTGDGNHYDLVVTQRSIMAILDRDAQLRLLQMVREHLKDSGLGILSEGTQQGLDELNRLRAQLGIAPFDQIWHSLYVDQNHMRQIFSSVSVEDFSSTYWLITRAIYPYFEEPKHNTLLHKFASELPQIGDFGLVKFFLVRP
jgi:SAM-dependent methyltransferase